MKKQIVLIVALICICLLFGCGTQEQKQGDNNMQYFFGGKVLEAGEDYLLLEVFDTGNSNLSEGAKVEVSTEVVSAKGCPKFAVDEYAKVLMARNADDNPPGRLEALSIYKTDETGSPLDAVHELKNGELEFVVEPGTETVQKTLDVFKTNTTQIIVTSDSKLSEEGVKVSLYRIKDAGNEVFIGTSVLSAEENQIIFTNLTSANNYKIGVSVESIEESITLRIGE